MVDTQRRSLEARARIATRRVGLQAIKSRRRDQTTNQDGVTPINPKANILTHGEGFSLSTEDVSTYQEIVEQPLI